MCENEKGCKNCNNNAFAAKPNMQRCIGCVSPGYKNFECVEESGNMTDNKPLTIAELEKMDGLPVYVVGDDCTGWHLVNIDAKYLISKYMGYISYNTKNVKVYKEKPNPRMVTIETAIKDKLMVKSKHNGKFGKPLDSLLEIVLTNSIYNKCDYLFEPVWEVKEG